MPSRYSREVLWHAYSGTARVTTQRKEATVDATDMGNDLKEILVTAEDMDRRLGEMAEQIDRDYAGEELLIVGVLRGAVMVMADLSRKMRTTPEVLVPDP